jgi:citrate/tricarballylate utilization protein
LLQNNLDSSESLKESERVMNICNACRYCEGFCAVFPAMEKRLQFGSGDLRYLANLCHDCRECYHACQYAPPHEFQLNVPAALSSVREQSYADYAWPGFMVKLSANPVYTLIMSIFFLPLLFLVAGVLSHGRGKITSAYSDEEGAFYQVVSHATMAWGFGIAGLFVVVAFVVGWRRFRRDNINGTPDTWDWRDVRQAFSDALELRYLYSSGQGCTYPNERASLLRPWFHHFTFYGFMLCFAATSAATIYHYIFGLPAPYPFLSIPVILGTLGGIGLIIGPLGLLYLKWIRDTDPDDPEQAGRDITLLVLLLMISVTGLLLLLLRETSAMGGLLLVHLGLVMGLFLTMPYGRFVHGLYRLGALIRFAKEERVS